MDELLATCPPVEAWSTTSIAMALALGVALVCSNLAWWFVWLDEKDMRKVDNAGWLVQQETWNHRRQLLEASARQWFTAYKAIQRDRAQRRPGVITMPRIQLEQLALAPTELTPVPGRRESERVPRFFPEPPPLSEASTIDLSELDFEVDVDDER